MSEKLSSKENVEIAIQTGLQLVPYVGPALSAAYFGTKNEKRFKRIESFYKELSEKIQQENVSFPDMNSHNEDELIALIEILNEKIEREHTAQKRENFKKYFINTLASPTGNFDEKRFFLEALASMTLLECELLSFLQQKQTTPDDFINVGSINKPGVDQYAVVGSIGRLKNLGFVKAVTGSFSIGGGDNTLRENIRTSEFGQQFINYCLT